MRLRRITELFSSYIRTRSAMRSTIWSLEVAVRYLVARVRLRRVMVTIVMLTLAGQHAVFAAGGELTRPRPIRESVNRYVRSHSEALAQLSPPPPGPGPKKFPWRTLLIGLGIGCGLGVDWVESESEGYGHHGKDKLLACLYLGGIGGFAAIAH